MRFFLLFCHLVATHLTASTGSLTGTVPLPADPKKDIPVEKYTGKISGRVAPLPKPVAAVWLESSRLTAIPQPATISLNQSNYQFEKSLLVVATGTTVLFPNKDPDYHNIYSLSRAKRFDLGRYKKSENPAPSVLFDKPGFISLHCEIHDHMRASVVVVDSPHFTVTDSSGRFTLPKLAPGSYTLRAQLDRKTSWSIPVVVQAGKSLTVSFPKK